eukprot:TRINITY_DN5045_c0_g3_i1.p1 TRINITY_DN5045_c0_g3~~TRINITY_DN5045_c0_g3_i1.p1  ORF type:complete len:1000 (-),score=145.94 TRINITY_DN5045_c0_g3_i1:79-3078(-)
MFLGPLLALAQAICVVDTFRRRKEDGFLSANEPVPSLSKRFVRLPAGEEACPILARIGSESECKEASEVLELTWTNRSSDPFSLSGCVFAPPGSCFWNDVVPSIFQASAGLQQGTRALQQSICRTGSYRAVTVGDGDAAESPCPEAMPRSVEECRAAAAMLLETALFGKMTVGLAPAHFSCAIQSNADTYTSGPLVEYRGPLHAFRDREMVFGNTGAGAADINAKLNICRDRNNSELAQTAVEIIKSNIAEDGTLKKKQQKFAVELAIQEIGMAGVPGIRAVKDVITRIFGTKGKKEVQLIALESIGRFLTAEFEEKSSEDVWTALKMLYPHRWKVSKIMNKFKKSSVPLVRLAVAELSGAYGEVRRKKSNQEKAKADREKAKAETALNSTKQAKAKAETALNSTLQAKAKAETALNSTMQAKAKAEIQKKMLELSQVFGKQTKKLFQVQGPKIMVPAGTMLLSTSAHELSAHRCPNWYACPGLDVHPMNSSSDPELNLTSVEMCAKGYSADRAGCAACVRSYGRRPFDPFECTPCPKSFVSWLQLFVVPAVVFLLGVQSADETTCSLLEGVIKICVSHFASTSILMRMLMVSQAYDRFQGHVTSLLHTFFFGFTYTAAAGSGMHTSGNDCWLQLVSQRNSATLQDMLLIDLLTPLGIALLYLCGVFLYQCVRSSRSLSQNWALLICRPAVVFVYVFLPPYLGAVSRYAPCIHTQAREEGVSTQVMAYDLDASCDERPNFLIVLGLFACILIGPISWFGMLKYENQTQELVFCEQAQHDWRTRLQAALTQSFSAHGSWQGLAVGWLDIQDARYRSLGCTYQCKDHTVRTTELEEPQAPIQVNLIITNEVRADCMRFLSARYRKGYEWWEIAVLVHRLVLAAVQGVCPLMYSESTFLVNLQLISGFALFAQAVACPYKLPVLNGLHIAAFCTSFATVPATVVVIFQDGSWTVGPDLSMTCLVFALVINSLMVFLLCAALAYAVKQWYGSETGGNNAAVWN